MEKLLASFVADIGWNLVVVIACCCGRASVTGRDPIKLLNGGDSLFEFREKARS